MPEGLSCCAAALAGLLSPGLLSPGLLSEPSGSRGLWGASGALMPRQEWGGAVFGEELGRTGIQMDPLWFV